LQPKVRPVSQDQLAMQDQLEKLELDLVLFTWATTLRKMVTLQTLQ
jgi:hypothetical protein